MLTFIRRFLNYILKKNEIHMEKPKPPIKFKINLISNREKIDGIAIFHDQEFKISVKATKNIEIMKIPFKILGIMDEPHLVRFSGETGVYTEYRPIIQDSSKDIEIESDEILRDLSKSKKKYDTIEIFVN